MQNYRRNGYRVAINLASANQASALLDRFQPDFLKIDVRRLPSPEVLSGIVARTARRGTRVIVKRIESPGEVALAEQGGAEFLQGYAFDGTGAQPVPPSADPFPAGASRNTWAGSDFLRAQDNRLLNS